MQNPVLAYLILTTRGIFQTVAALLRSRKFITLLSGLATLLITARVPTLAPYYDYIFAFILIGSMTYIGGTAYEDAARVALETKAPANTTAPGDVIKTVVDELIRDSANPLGEEHRANVTATVEAQLVSKPAAPPNIADR